MNVLLYLSSLLVAGHRRAAWREEWRAEVAAVATSRGALAALRLSLGAPIDALSSRWTTRATSGSRWDGAWHTDIKQTARSLMRSPGHVLTVSLCLGVGIAVCPTTFSILNAFMHGDRPGIEDRAHMPRVYIYGNQDHRDASLEEFAVLAEQAPAFDGIAAEGRAEFSIRVPGHQPMHVVGAFVNGAFFNTLGTRPLAGRLLSPADDQRTAPLAVVLGHAFWKGRIGSPADIVGRTIVIGDREAVVAGVAPEGFAGLASDDVDGPGGFKVYVPLAHAPGWPGVRPSNLSWLNMAGRVRGDVDPSAITAQMQPVAARLEAMNPERRRDARIVVDTTGLAPGTGAGEVLAMMLLMMAAPLTVLAIGCANVANLQLVRASLRSRELAVRASLGASRGQVVRLLTLEAAMLAIGGLAAAAALMSVLLNIAELVVPIPVDVDLRVLLFSIGMAVLAVGATGVLPALAATRGRTAEGLRAGGRSMSAGNSRIRRGLVVAQVSLCFLLLLTAAVFTRGLILLTGQMPEHATRTLVTEVRFTIRNYPLAERRRVLDEFEARMRADNRVETVAFASTRPLRSQQTRFWLPADNPEVERYGSGIMVSPAFFHTSHVALLRGRTFTPGENTAVIINDAFIAEHQLTEPVLGTTLKVDFGEEGEAARRGRMATIVGVAASIGAGPGGPNPIVYMPMPPQAAPNYVGIWVRTPYAREMAEVARQTLAQVDPELPALAIRTLDDYIEEDARPLTHIANTAGGLGAVALLLAISGVYSVIAFFVALRTSEFGIRMALGARAADIVRMVIGQATRLVGLGLLVGAVLGTPLLVALHSFFPFARPFDPLVIVPTALALTLTAVAASWIPARRAAAIEASVALRAD